MKKNLKPKFTAITAIVSIIFGVLSFVLVEIDRFEYQVVCSVLAVFFSVYSILKGRSRIALIGLFLGLLFLFSIGLLWLIWPK